MKIYCLPILAGWLAGCLGAVCHGLGGDFHYYLDRSK